MTNVVVKDNGVGAASSTGAEPQWENSRLLKVLPTTVIFKGARAPTGKNVGNPQNGNYSWNFCFSTTSTTKRSECVDSSTVLLVLICFVNVCLFYFYRGVLEMFAGFRVTGSQEI